MRFLEVVCGMIGEAGRSRDRRSPSRRARRSRSCLALGSISTCPSEVAGVVAVAMLALATVTESLGFLGGNLR